MATTFLSNLDDHLSLFNTLHGIAGDVHFSAASIVQTLAKGGKLLICGNGGSAADSQHLAAEFTGRFIKDRPPISALALSTDSSALTCIGNDYSFDEVFSRQLLALGRQGDCLLGISTSGNSRNIVRAVEEAKKIGITTIGLLGREGGTLIGMCDISIVVRSATTARIQEAHILIGHTICGMVEESLGLV